ncbi:MAG TPA: putative glycolipid-binding domain-containing protein [Chryseolinea sp.]|nr:putative glycolipid-binding domain-containing protein [Chryseolinea sp.]
MQTNILWKGLEYHSLENCVLTKIKSGWSINSTIVGAYDKKIYKVEYVIKANDKWETIYLNLTTELAGSKRDFIFLGDGNGNWTNNGIPKAEFEGCVDVDISLTPFTNSLPIKRLLWETNKSRQIKVLFVDVLGGAVIPVQQRYTKLSNAEFRFENVPNDFEAVITVDDLGLVLNYPELFIQTDRQ